MIDIDVTVSVMEMMQAREYRTAVQKALTEKYNLPLICFTLNIPGPVKVFDGVEEAFLAGCSRIEAALKGRCIPVADQKTITEKTGYEAFYCVRKDPVEIKKMMVAIEDQDSLGRLFDIDVLTVSCEKLSREDYGLPSRRCMLCQKPAHECSRSRAHSVEELLSHIHRIFTACLKSPETNGARETTL